jgi:uncharacterized membrane protein YeaQ/YmgE (transglycosylase-associated protein family)
MGILWYILIGAVVGILARLIHPGKENMNWLVTILIGILGCFLAGLIGDLLGWWDRVSWLGFLVSIVVAVILVTLYGVVFGKKK